MAVGLTWMWAWWAFMVLINIVNVISAIFVFKHSRSRSMKEDKEVKYRRWMLVMGFIFTFVGLWRSIFVTSYGARRAWFGIILNSAGVVRTLAMFAEMSFAGLIAYAMIKFNEYVPASEDVYRSNFKKFIYTKSPYILPICIFIANVCVNTKLFVGLSLLGTIEETLWSIGFLSILPLAIIQLRRILKIKDKSEIARLRKLKISAIVILLWCVVYCTYGLTYHLPTMWMYEIGVITSTGYPPLTTGIAAIIDPFTNINVSRSDGTGELEWSFGFMLWHSAYFSICVWISVFLMQAPRPITNPGEPNIKLTRIILVSISFAIVVLLVFIILPLFL